MKTSFEGTIFCSRPEKRHKSNQDYSININDFNVQDYYYVTKDEFQNADAVKLAYNGSLLIAQYYFEKCKANLKLLNAKNNSGMDDLYDNLSVYLAEARKNQNYRQAFLLGMDEPHAVPIIYFKENEQEGLLIADSLGTSIMHKAKLKKLNQKIAMPIYVIQNKHQSDTYSCYTDALLMGIKCTAINKETQSYELADLLSILKSRAEPKPLKFTESVFFTKLPDALLTTCLISDFLDFHKEKDGNKLVHKNESLTDFRNRYTDKNLIIKEFNKDTEVIEERIKDVYTYPRKKGLKFANIIIIQFYLNQINACERSLSTDERADFINKAKTILALTTNFESKINDMIQLVKYYIMPQAFFPSNEARLES